MCRVTSPPGFVPASAAVRESLARRSRATTDVPALGVARQDERQPAAAGPAGARGAGAERCQPSMRPFSDC